jgi:PAS domain S-box-containing protein
MGEHSQAAAPPADELALLQAVLDHLPIGVVVAEAPSGRIVRWNRYARALAGAPLESAAVTDQWEIYDEHGRPVAARCMPGSRALLDGETITRERAQIVLADGLRHVVETSATPIRDADGAVVAAVVLFEDVSAQLRREQAEREFVANAAHELRTPLTAIAGAIEVLQAGAKEVPEERDRFLGHIDRECARLGRLSRALLLLARVQTLAERPRLEIVALRPLLHDVAAASRPAPGVTLSVACNADVAALTNRDLVEQALLNLAGNATRYTPSGAVTLSATPHGTSVLIEVRDTGPGLSAETRDRAFDRFFRADARGAESSGLGLSIAQQAVEAVGGTIRLESPSGRGTTASIELPLARLVDA